MNKTIFRLFAVLLTLVMLISMLSGCFTPINDSSSDVNTNDKTDNSTVTDPTQITTTIYDISKYGNLTLYMYGSELFDKGYEHGDILEITIGDKKWDIPLCTNYSDVDSGVAVLRARSATDGVVLAINTGDFATSAGIATKTVIEEDPGYRWDYLVDTSVEVTITMKEKGGYRDEWLIRQLVRTNERADYSHLSDEAFANFRVITTSGVGKGVLYRSSSPINPDLGRNTYADKAARDAGIKTIVNLADMSNTYGGAENTYYSTCQVTYLNLGMDFLSEASLSSLANGMRFIINNEGPYLIHCNEGKDRAGFVSALLECLMGATIDEVIDDYMVTYYNYYGVEKGSEKYDAVVKSNIVKSLSTYFKVADVYKANLAKEAEEYLLEDVGLTADEVTALKARLRITLNEVYDSGKNISALLGDHKSVYVQIVSDGNIIREEYLDKHYYYTFYSSEHLNSGFEYSALKTDHSEYYYFDNIYAFNVMLTPDGIADMKNRFATSILSSFISYDMLDDDNAIIIEKDGLIIVSVSADEVELQRMGENIASCVETYTIDAKTREMIGIKTVYTFKDGTIEEGIVTISRDVEAPKNMNAFLKYEQETENMYTVTIVSNPGAENEKTESIQVPQGLQVAISTDYDLEECYTLFTDADCTEPSEGTWDANTDLTIFVKWDK